VVLALLQTSSAPASSPLSFLPIHSHLPPSSISCCSSPCSDRRKQTAKMLTELQNGNVVITSGGIVGSIVSIGDDETLVIRVKT